MCGNGVVEYGEECDDGDTVGGDGCGSTSKNEFCGDGSVRRTISRLWFSFLGRSCNDRDAEISFSLNGVEVARAPLPSTCDCQPGIVMLNVTDPALLSLGHNGVNVVEMQATGVLAWASVHIETPEFATESTLFDAGGGNDAGNRNPDLCAAGSQDGAGVGTSMALGGGEECDDGNTNNDDACSNTCQINACLGVVCTSLGQCQTSGSCNPATGACDYTVKADGTPCSDDNACTVGDACQAGACVSGNAVTCAEPDQCHQAGACEASTGVCSYPTKEDGTVCSDGNACTIGDTCQAGACASGVPVTCAAADQCHDTGTCESGHRELQHPGETRRDRLQRRQRLYAG